MNILEMKDELETRLAKSATPRARIIGAILLLSLIVYLCWIEAHHLQDQKAAAKAKAAEHASGEFGAALQRAGIATQAQPSH